jgi:hypothetical protein
MRMGDSDEAPPSPSPPPARRRIIAFTSDRIIAAFTVVLPLTNPRTCRRRHFSALRQIDAVRATNRLAEASENAISDRRHAASAKFILKMDEKLD